MRLFKNNSAIGTLAILVALVLVFSGTNVGAQDVATGSATATVLTVLAVVASQALQFGDVMQGVRKAIANNVDASSGIFAITGASLKEVSAYMQLPDYLWNSTNEDRLVISFSATDAVIDTLPGTPTAPGLGNSGNVDPHNLPEFQLADGGTGSIYLGGTVWPTVDQRNAAYAADIILTVAYTGQ